jgi:hypothetical protein
MSEEALDSTLLFFFRFLEPQFGKYCNKIYPGKLQYVLDYVVLYFIILYNIAKLQNYRHNLSLIIFHKFSGEGLLFLFNCF